MSVEIEIVEVGPRDGLQNEDTILSTSDKIHLIDQLVRAGAIRIEATSFVSQRAVPQLADAEAVLDGLQLVSGARPSALILNKRGLERALDAGIDEINFALLATDSFNQRNQGKTTIESVVDWSDAWNEANAHGHFTTLTIGAAFGCPFEGEVEVERLKEIVEKCLEAALPDELCLADTIGSGVPTDVTRRINAVRETGYNGAIRCHFHNTRNSGYANAIAAVDAGATALDASIGGLGGCPFAPQASGNIATEDLAFILERSGFRTGLDLERLCNVTRWVEAAIGHGVSSMLPKAGGFPAAAAPK